jgi:hypothetical protein
MARKLRAGPRGFARGRNATLAGTRGIPLFGAWDCARPAERGGLHGPCGTRGTQSARHSGGTGPGSNSRGTSPVRAGTKSGKGARDLPHAGERRTRRNRGGGQNLLCHPLPEGMSPEFSRDVCDAPREASEGPQNDTQGGECFAGSADSPGDLARSSSAAEFPVMCLHPARQPLNRAWRSAHKRGGQTPIARHCDSLRTFVRNAETAPALAKPARVPARSHHPHDPG